MASPPEDYAFGCSELLSAVAANDMATLEYICSADVVVELVRGARLDGFEQSGAVPRACQHGAGTRVAPAQPAV